MFHLSAKEKRKKLVSSFLIVYYYYYYIIAEQACYSTRQITYPFLKMNEYNGRTDYGSRGDKWPDFPIYLYIFAKNSIVKWN